MEAHGFCKLQMRTAVDVSALGLLHLAVDMTTAGFLVSRFVFVSDPSLAVFAVLGYNLLAFGLQPLFGALIDVTRRVGPFLFGSLALVGVFGLINFQIFFNLVVLSVANAAFHAGAAAAVIAETPDRAWGLGVYVAPGAIGVTVGINFFSVPVTVGAIVCLAALLLAPLFRERECRAFFREEARAVKPGKLFWIPLLLVLIAVFVRGFGGTLVRPSWQTAPIHAVFIALAVAVGKAGGGFLADRLGAPLTAVLTLVPAAVLLSFFGENITCSLIGLLLFNTAMPVTLFLAVGLLPRFRAFAFGLTAAVLMAGSLAGNDVFLSVGFRWQLLFSLTLAGAACIAAGARSARRIGASVGPAIFQIRNKNGRKGS